MVRILVQGWRGISHSYAMVNQYQLLELARRPDVTLQHQDVPFFRPEWNAQRCSAGFDRGRAERIATLAPFDGTSPDITYRIAFPYRVYGANAGRLFVFGTAERQRVVPEMIYQGPEAQRHYPVETIDIVTPSNWSKQGFVRYGFAEARVHVVPHGVDPAIFRPTERDERQKQRRAMGLNDDKFVFLNLGGTTANKGLDLLIRAFAVVHARQPETVLLLKDCRALYGFTAEAHVHQTLAQYGLPEDLWHAIGVIPDNLDLDTLRLLYGTADAYVSPYRAEGFNLPPLEAAACGLPVLITEGGATDDYAHPSFAHKIAARPHSTAGEDWLEPEFDSLVSGMEELAAGRKGSDLSIALPFIGEHFSWANVTGKLLAAFSA